MNVFSHFYLCLPQLGFPSTAMFTTCLVQPSIYPVHGHTTLVCCIWLLIWCQWYIIVPARKLNLQSFISISYYKIIHLFIVLKFVNIINSRCLTSACIYTNQMSMKYILPWDNSSRNFRQADLVNHFEDHNHRKVSILC